MSIAATNDGGAECRKTEPSLALLRDVYHSTTLAAHQPSFYYQHGAGCHNTQQHAATAFHKPVRGGSEGGGGASAEFQLKNVFRVFCEKPSLCCWCVCHNLISWLETSVSTSVTPTSDFRGNAVQVSATSLQCIPPAFLIYWHFTPFFYCAAENVPMHQVGDVTFVVAEALGPAVLVVLL